MLVVPLLLLHSFITLSSGTQQSSQLVQASKMGQGRWWGTTKTRGHLCRGLPRGAVRVRGRLMGWLIASRQTTGIKEC